MNVLGPLLVVAWVSIIALYINLRIGSSVYKGTRAGDLVARKRVFGWSLYRVYEFSNIYGHIAWLPTRKMTKRYAEGIYAPREEVNYRIDEL